MVESSKIPSVSALWSNIKNEIGRGFTSFYEADTDRLYDTKNTIPRSIYSGQQSTVRAGFHSQHTSSHIRLLGKDFFKTKPAQFWHLEKYNGMKFTSNPLTEFNDHTKLLLNKNNVVFEQADRGHLRQYDVAKFTLDDLPANNPVSYRTADPDALADKSFLISFDFRTASVHSPDVLFQYGVLEGATAGSPGVGISAGFDSDDHLNVRTHSGITVSTQIPGIHLRDEEWHRMIIFLDRTRNSMSTIITQVNELELYDVQEWTGTLGSLQHENTIFTVGGYSQSTSRIEGLHSGDISNFKIYAWDGTPDYQTLKAEIAGIRDNPNDGMTITENHNTSTRLAQKTRMTGPIGAYTYAVFKSDEGEYDITFSHNFGPNNSSFEIFLDGISHGILDGQAAVGITDQEVFLDSVKLGKGPHFLKLQIVTPQSGTGVGGINFSDVLINKHSGSDEGGAAEGEILGGELRERSQYVTVSAEPGAPFANKIGTTDSTKPNQTAGGPIYFTGGLKKLILMADKAPDYGIMKVDINDETVFTFDGYSETERRGDRVVVWYNMPQGKNKVRVYNSLKNDASTGYGWNMNGIRMIPYEAHNSSKTSILPIDEDFQPLAGSLINHGTAYFHGAYNNMERRQPGVGTAERNLREFCGGLYLLTVSIRQYGSAGTQSISVITGDTETELLGDINNMGSGGNLRIQKPVYLKPGKHWLKVKNNSAAHNPWTGIDFDGIIRDPRPIAKPNNLLAYHPAGFNITEADLYLAGVTSQKYDKVILTIKGDASVDTAVILRLNELYTGNFKKESNRNGIVSTSTNTDLALVGDDIIDGKFTSITDLVFSNNTIHGFSQCASDKPATESSTWTFSLDIYSLNRIELGMAGNVDAEITLRGVPL